MQWRAKSASCFRVVYVLIYAAAVRLGEANALKSSRSKSEWTLPVQPLKRMQWSTGTTEIPEELQQQQEQIRRRLQEEGNGKEKDDKMEEASEAEEGVLIQLTSLNWFKMYPSFQETSNSVKNKVTFCGTVTQSDPSTHSVFHAYTVFFDNFFTEHGGFHLKNKTYLPELFIIDDKASAFGLWFVTQIMLDSGLITDSPCHYYFGPSNPDLVPLISSWAYANQGGLAKDIVTVFPTQWNDRWVKFWPMAISVRHIPDLQIGVDILQEAGDVKSVAILYELSQTEYARMVEYALLVLALYPKIAAKLFYEVFGTYGRPSTEEIYETTSWTYSACASALRAASELGWEVVAFESIDYDINQTRRIAEKAPDAVVACMDYTDPVRCTRLVEMVKAGNLDPKAFIITGCAEAGDHDWMNTKSGFEGRFFLSMSEWNLALLQKIDDLHPGHVLGMSADRWIEMMHPFSKDPKTAAAWAACEVFVHAIITAGTVENRSAVYNALLQHTNDVPFAHRLYGNITLDETRRNSDPLLVLQYQQPVAGYSPGYDPSRSEQMAEQIGHPFIIAPAEYATGPVWHPRPSWDQYECLRTDSMSGDHGFNLTGVTNETLVQWMDCLHCPIGALGSNVHREVSINEFQNDSVSPLYVRHCVACGSGTERQDSYATVRGKYSPVSTIKVLSCRDCMPGYMSAAAGLQCQACPFGTSQPRPGQAECLECLPGRSQLRTGQSACIDCEEGRVSEYNKSRNCAPCPPGADCPVGESGLRDVYQAKKGWYIYIEEDREMNKKYDGVVYTPSSLFVRSGRPHKCPYAKGAVCKGSNECWKGPDGEATMEGLMCGRCAPGAQRHHEFGRCFKCSSFIVTVALSFLNFLWMLMFIIYLLWESICVSSPCGTRQIRVLIFKQAMDYMMMWQMITPMSELPEFGAKNSLGYGYGTIDIINFFTYVYGVRSLPNMEAATACYMGYLYTSNESFFSYVTFSFLMVPLWQFLTFLVFVMFKLIAVLFDVGSQMESMLNALWNITIWFLHFRILRMLGVVLRCKTFDVERLIPDPTYRCWEGEVLKWQILAVVGLILIGLGLPFLMFCDLRSRTWKDPHLKGQNLVRGLGFFFLGLRPQAFYFEYVNMVKRALLQLMPLLPIFLDTSRSAVFLLILLLFCSYHHYVRPFDSRYSDVLTRVWSMIHMTIVTTICISMLMESTNQTEVFGKSEENRAIRDTVLAACMSLMHASCNIFILLCLIDSSFVNISEAHRGRGILHYFFAQSIEYFGPWLRTGGMSPLSKKAFLHIIGRITVYHLNFRKRINWEEYEQSLHQLMITVAYWSELKRVNDDSCIEVRKADRMLLQLMYGDRDLESSDVSKDQMRNQNPLSLLTPLVKRFHGDKTPDDFYVRALDRQLERMKFADRLKRESRYRGVHLSMDRMHDVMTEFGQDIVRKVIVNAEKRAAAEQSQATGTATSTKTGALSTGQFDEFVRIKRWEDMGFQVEPDTGRVHTITLQDLRELDAIPTNLHQREIAFKETILALRHKLMDVRQENEQLTKHVVEYGTCHLSDELRLLYKKPEPPKAKGVGITVIGGTNLQLPDSHLLEGEDPESPGYKSRLSVQCMCTIAGCEYSHLSGFTTASAIWSVEDGMYRWDHHYYIPEFLDDDRLEITIFASESHKMLFSSTRAHHHQDEGGAEIIASALVTTDVFFPEGFNGDIQLEDLSGNDYDGATLQIKVDPSQHFKLFKEHEKSAEIHDRVMKYQKDRKQAAAKKAAQQTPKGQGNSLSRQASSTEDPLRRDAAPVRASSKTVEADMTGPDRRNNNVSARTAPRDSAGNFSGADSVESLEEEAQALRKRLTELKAERAQREAGQQLASMTGQQLASMTGQQLASMTHARTGSSQAIANPNAGPSLSTVHHAGPAPAALPSREVLREQLAKLQSIFTSPFIGTVQPSSARPEEKHCKEELDARQELTRENDKADELHERLQEVKEDVEGLKSEAEILKATLISAGKQVPNFSGAEGQ